MCFLLWSVLVGSGPFFGAFEQQAGSQRLLNPLYEFTVLHTHAMRGLMSPS